MIKQTLQPTIRVIEEVSEENLLEYSYHRKEYYAPQVRADGIGSRTITKRLHSNALVRRLDVVASASRADAALLANAGQVRLQEAAAGQTTVVVDFGTPRTVSSVGIADGPGAPNLKVLDVHLWDGVKFAPTALYSAAKNGTDNVTARLPSTAKIAIFPEVRTERLQITFVGTAEAAAVSTGVWVRLPDAPANLELRIDGAAPVWSAPGPAEPNTNGWSAAGTQTIELGPALTALTGDPTSDEEVDFQLVLSARVPGKLDLVEQTSSTSISYVYRIAFGAETRQVLDFTAEGPKVVSLAVPSWVESVEEVSFSVLGKLGNERVVPPIGPALATSLAGADRALGVAELVLDIDRAACVRLPTDSGLVELTAVRLPLTTDAAGAEARVLLLTPTATASSEPSVPIDGGVSQPVVITRAAAEQDPWLTFSFDAPPEIDPARPPWAAIIVGRGTLFWSLGQFTSPALALPIRRGPPNGPWQVLPSVISANRTFGGRVRMVGNAAPATPLAPLAITVGAAPATRVTPTAKGVRSTWKPPSAVAPTTRDGQKFIDLTITSHCAASLTLQDVDIIARRLPES